ncbi:hypothetical protein LAWASA_4114 [Lawsonibacter asaccharolyticus]|nr:hypothetical protein LAWASA_4114 [Lawsonibacter asaccharolyticus]
MWYPKIVVANGGALHGPDIGSREGTGSGERCLERRIIPPDFFVKKDWRTHGCDSREEAFFLNGEKPPGFVLFAESRGAGRFRIETDAGSVRPAKKESPCRRSSRDFFVGFSAATCP